MPSPTAKTNTIGFVEFVSLLAITMSLVALSIDAMLPALPDIGAEFSVARANDTQFVITALFAGLALGQLFAGPLSDSIGRKKGIYGGLALFVVGCLIAYFSQSFEWMLAGRFIQGMGAACPRIITIAIVRDRYEGRDMARVMSYIMGVFIFVPAIAPTIGQGIMHIFDWRAVFLFFLVIAGIVFIWLSKRLQETLNEEDIRPFTLPVIWEGIKHVCSNRMTICYTIAAGFIFGAFIGYLNSAQLIFQDYYNVGSNFPYYFGTTALALGAAFFTNAHLVKIYGMRKVALCSLSIMALFAFMFGVYEWSVHGTIPLIAFMIYIMSSAFCMGMLFGNFNAMAMVPMGHMAGIASSVIGCISLIISLLAGGMIGQLYDGNLIPLTSGFFFLSLTSLAIMFVAESKQPAQPE